VEYVAHTEMLNKMGILADKEINAIVKVLKEIIKLSRVGKFKITPMEEDCYTKSIRACGKEHSFQRSAQNSFKRDIRKTCDLPDIPMESVS